MSEPFTASSLVGATPLQAILAHYAFYDGRIDGGELLPARNANVNARVSIDGQDWVVKR